jgi:hypothetical protein
MTEVDSGYPYLMGSRFLENDLMLQSLYADTVPRYRS